MATYGRNPNYTVISGGDGVADGTDPRPRYRRGNADGSVPSAFRFDNSNVEGDARAVVREYERRIKRLEEIANERTYDAIRDAKIEFRRRFLASAKSHLEKSFDPWYRFASLCVSNMGGVVNGNVTRDDLLAFSEDFGSDPVWNDRRRSDRYKTNDFGTTHTNDAHVSLEDEERRDDASASKIVPPPPGATGIDVDALETRYADDLRRRGKTELKEENEQDDKSLRQNLKDGMLGVVNRYFGALREEGAREMSEIVDVLSQRLLDELVIREARLKLEDLEERESGTSTEGKERGKGANVGKHESEEVRLSMEKGYQALLDRFMENRKSELRLTLEKEANRAKRLLGGDASGTSSLSKNAASRRSRAYGRRSYSEIESRGGLTLFNPTFKALIETCTADLNLHVGDGIRRNFTPEELCLHPEISTQFAKFVALRAVPASYRTPVAPPLPVKRGEGYTVYAVSGTSRYANAADKAEIQAFYEFAKRIRRGGRDGLYVASSGASKFSNDAPGYYEYDDSSRSFFGYETGRERIANKRLASSVYEGYGNAVMDFKQTRPFYDGRNDASSFEDASDRYVTKGSGKDRWGRYSGLV
jgi:hypothetical protein